MPVLEQLTTDQTDPWQVVSRQVFTPNDDIDFSRVAVLSRVGCLWVTDVMILKLHITGSAMEATSLPLSIIIHGLSCNCEKVFQVTFKSTI